MNHLIYFVNKYNNKVWNHDSPINKLIVTVKVTKYSIVIDLSDCIIYLMEIT